MIGWRSHLAATGVALGIIICSMLALSAITSNIHLTKSPIYPESGLQFHTLPAALPPNEPRWRQVGADAVMSAEGAEELGTSNYISRWYERAGEVERGEVSDLVQLHCAYYTGMLDTVPHVPERCMVGGGMMKSGSTTLVSVPISFARLSPDSSLEDDDGREAVWTARSAVSHGRVRLPRGIEDLTVRVTAFKNQDGSNRVLTGYFFVANGHVYASANDVRIKAFDLEEDYAYYAKVQFMSPTAKTPEELAALAGDMLDDLFPEIMRRVPDWTRVELGEYPETASKRTTEGSPGA